MGLVGQEHETFKSYKQRLLILGGKRFFPHYYIAAKVDSLQVLRKKTKTKNPNSILSPNSIPIAPFHCMSEIQTVIS